MLFPHACIEPHAQSNMVFPIGCATLRDGKNHIYFYASMVWVAYSILLDPDLAEDVAQQTFAIAWQKMADLRKSERFGAWLAKICRNTCHQIHREKKRIRNWQKSAVLSETNHETNDDSQEGVRAAIDGLRPMYREVIILRYYHDMDYAGIGSLLDIPVSRVRGRLLRAKNKIESYLRRRGQVPSIR